VLDTLLHWFGIGLCHQLPERSYIAGGVQAPVCVRDTGIYLGFTLALIVIALLHRKERPRGFPRWHVWVVMALLLALMGWDGVTSYAGWRVTTNAIRLATGLGVGFSSAAIVVPMLNDELWVVPGAGRVLDPPWRFLAWIAAMPAAFVLIHLIGPLTGVLLPLSVALGIIVTLTSVNLVVVGMLPAFDRRARRVRDLALPVVIAVAVAFVEVALAAQLRLLLLGLAARFT